MGRRYKARFAAGQQPDVAQSSIPIITLVAFITA